MASINLLPKGKVFKEQKKREINLSFLVSVFLIFFSVFFLLFLFVKNRELSSEIDYLNKNLFSVDRKLEEEIKKNKLLMFKNKEDEISFLLTNHYYFSNIIDILQNNITNEIYLDRLDIYEDKNVIGVKIKGIARNYSAVASQLYVLKNLPEINGAKIEEISDDGASLSFIGNVYFKKEAALYENKK